HDVAEARLLADCFGDNPKYPGVSSFTKEGLTMEVCGKNFDIGFHALSCNDDLLVLIVVMMMYFDMFPHLISTGTDTLRFKKSLLLDMVPYGGDTRVDANEDVNHIEVDSFVRVEESQGEVNEIVVKDSGRVEDSYDDVALIDKIDYDSYAASYVYEGSGEEEDIIDIEDFDSDSDEEYDIENINSSKLKQLRKRKLQEDGVVNKPDFYSTILW
nr:hypothetical protein [Tanacetum cinerariifolium]